MRTIKTLAHSLQTVLDPSSIEDYCPNDIQVLNTGEITKIATSVSASLEVIHQAAALGVEALIVHHGIFWKGDSHIEGIQYKKIKMLMDHNIALLCYHLPLDCHQSLGNNWKAARDLGWINLASFGTYDKTEIGVQGTFDPIGFNDLKQRLETYYQHEAHCVSAHKKKLRSGAIVSGGAHKLLKQAVASGVDCFITGSFDEPIWDLAHEENIAFFALGHTATEKIGPKALATFIQDTYALSCTFIDTENPF